MELSHFKERTFVCLFLALVIFTPRADACTASGSMANIAIIGEYSTGYLQVYDLSTSSIVCTISVGYIQLAMVNINTTSVAVYLVNAAWSYVGIVNLIPNSYTYVNLNKGSSTTTYGITYDPSRNYLINVNSDYTCQVWSLSSMSLVGTYSGHTSAVRSVLLLADGRVASGDSASTVRIWDLVYFGLALSFTSTCSGIYSLAQVSSTLIAVSGNNIYVYLYQISSGSLYSTISATGSTVYYIAAVSTNMLVIVGDSGYVMVRDWTSGAQLYSTTVSGAVFYTGSAVNNNQFLLGYSGSSAVYCYTISSSGTLTYTTYGISSNGLSGAQFMGVNNSTQAWVTTTTSTTTTTLSTNPYNGTCSVSPTAGTALTTVFTITCSNWIVNNGNVSSYSFYATYKDNTNTTNLGSKTTGSLSTGINAGMSTDSYKWYLSVQITSTQGSVTTYNLSTPIIVNATSSAEVLSSVTDLLSNGSLLANASVSEATATLSVFAQAISQSGNSTNLSESAASSFMAVNAQLVSVVSSLGPVTGVSNIDSVSSVLSTVSSNPTLISADTAVTIGSMCVDLVNNLAAATSGQDPSTLTSAASNILDAVTNSQKSVNNQNAGGSGVQSNQLTSAISSTSQVVNGVTNIASSILADDSTTEIESTNIKLAVTKTTASNIQTQQSTGGCTIDLGDPCLMLGLSAADCSSSSIVSQSFSMPYAFVGLNGDSGLNIGNSKSVGLKFFTGSMTENKVSNFEPGIQFWIAKSSSEDIPFEELELANMTQKASSQNQLLCFTISLTTPNQSITIDIMPLNSSVSVGYLIVLMYGQSPVISSTSQLYDSFVISCPSDLKQEGGDSFYRMFSNVSANKDLKSTAGYGFRQLSNSEFAQYCQSSNSSTQVPILPDSFDFSSLFSVPVSQRVFAAGCYYLDEATAQWSSDGTEVLEDSNTTHTHCVAKHLTQFAGGLVVLPPSIDFNNVWANASFTKNLTIYLTVIIVSALYLILLVLCRYKDWKDESRRSVFIMADNDSFSQYFYELIVFTGSRKDAGTHSRVSLILAGNESETDVRNLSPSREHHKNAFHVLQRGSVQSFLMAVDHSLGTELRYMRIWHDNSGRAQHASWFLKFVIVHDLQTRDKFYFICNDWLALDQSDGQINRLLPVATRKQKTEIKYLMEKQTKQNMSDGHLWFSVLARPITSPFTRTDRVTCAFVLLCITMLVNIMYYGQASNSESSSQLAVGPFNLSSTQIVIGVISNLLIFPPSFLLMQIFRKSRRRVTKTTVIKRNLKKCIDEENLEPKNGTPIKPLKKKVKKPFTLPWWFKIIGYMLAACFVGISIFFIIVKGISFGDDMCRKWLTSFLVSVVTSIVFTQPMQVVLLSIFFVLLFKKSNDDADQEQDHLDDGRPLNYAFTAKANGKTQEDDDAVLVSNSLRDKDFWNDEHLKEIKRKREQERRAWVIIKKLLVYILFLGLLFNVAYSKTSSKSYLYQTQLQNLMLPNISLVQTTDHVWSWLGYQFFPSVLKGKEWYNEQSTGSDNLVGDYSSILVGKIQMRMARVKSTSCSRKVGSGTCYFDYSVSSYDNTNYDVSWSTVTSSSSSSGISSAFRYTSALSINSQPYAGQYTNYLGGGYVYSVDAVNSNLSQVQQNLVNLQTSDWIDMSTRALFIEYTLYNVNEDLFCYCTILFEFLPTGTIVVSYEFDPISLFADESVVYVAIEIAYLFIIVFLMLSEIKLAIKIKKAYLTHWWSYVNWILIALTWTAFVMYLNRLYQKNHLLEKLNSEDDQVINFQLLNYWNQLLMIFLGFCCFMASVKVLQLVSFSRSVTFLMRVFRQCFIELAGFFVFYIILFMAFTQMMYLVVYDANSQFKSFASSLVTGFLMLIGKFNVDSFCQDAGDILGPMLYCIFAVTMIMVLLNMFITVLTDSFSRIRNEHRAENKDEDSLMLTFVKERVWPSFVSFVDIRSKFGRGKSYKASEQDNQYKDSMSAFETRVSDLTTIGKHMAKHE